VLVARLGGRVVGTVQLKLAQLENQAHRADVAKLLVHSSARRRGVAEALMAAVEGLASAEGRWLLVLDTLEGSDAERLYRRLGWSEAGSIPDYALVPGGSAATTVFWKRL
jgi:GNAT superfamily N-acetyltransferase